MALDIPGYKILRTLGRGGMATVYLAQQDIFERKVALKVMSKALADDEAFGKRFFREAKIVSQLVHPNIVTVYDVGQVEGNFFLSMEYIDGRDLKYLRKTLSLQQKITAVMDIARALKYAGEKGYVHRDIKPENILFHRSDGRAVLTDFGIARAAETDISMTQTGLAIGTPHYMSPEQAKGKQVDLRSDIYSLGVVFFLLLTGRVPFDAESAVAIGIKHITEAVPLLPAGMSALQPVIDTLLAKKPEYRYQDAGELIDDLKRIDVELLEQAIAFDQPAPETVDSESPTQESPLVTDEDLDQLYDQQDTIINERSGCASWLVGLLIIASLVAWVFYYQRPDIAEPWLQQGKVFAQRYYQNTRQWLDSESSSSAPQDTTQKPLIPTPLPATAEPTVIPTPTATPTLEPQLSDSLAKPSDGVNDAAPDDTGLTDEAAHNEAIIADVAPVVDITSFEKYQQQLESLQDLYQNDISYLAELVSLHRTILSDYPEKTEIDASLTRLRKDELQTVSDLLAGNKNTAATRKLEQLRALFPEAPASDFTPFEQRLAQVKVIDDLLAKADQYRDHKQLTTPRGHNALNSYREVLALEPSNALAKKGIQQVSSELVRLAQQAYEQDRLTMAQTDIGRALEAEPNNATAQKLKQQINAAMTYKREMRTWLTRARSRIDTQDYFSPAGDSAHYYYDRVLKREPNNTQAVTGQKQLVEGFARNIWSLVGNEQFDIARRQLTVALSYMPNNERLQSLSNAVDEVVAE